MIAKLEQCLPRRRIDLFGKNSLIMSSLPYYTLSLLSMISLFSTWSSYSKIAFVLIAVVYALFPILDEVFSLDERNPTP